MTFAFGETLGKPAIRAAAHDAKFPRPAPQENWVWDFAIAALDGITPAYSRNDSVEMGSARVSRAVLNVFTFQCGARAHRFSRRDADWMQPRRSRSPFQLHRSGLVTQVLKSNPPLSTMPETKPQFIMTSKLLSCRHWATMTLLLGILGSNFSNKSGLNRSFAAESGQASERKLLYVAEPGIRDYLEYGGHGLLVYDIDHGHHLLKRIPTAGIGKSGKPLNVKGVCANAATHRIYITTTETLTALDLVTEKILWEKSYEGGCDRLALSPDGKVIYLPSLEKEHWHVVDALTGDVIKKIVTKSGAHNTIYGLDGRHAYLAGLKSPILRVTDTKTHEVLREVGPFGNVIRPFTVNGAQTLCYVNVNELLGFEVGDLVTGKMMHRVEVQGFNKGPTKRHGCPSHGVGLTPDEKELWLTDAFNSRVHIFDNTVMPPKQIASIPLRDQPGWITFSLDGRYGYPSTGDIVEVATHKIVSGLKDEKGADVQSEKMVEIDMKGGKPIRVGDQFGLGRIRH